jgi:hypothetical protein
MLHAPALGVIVAGDYRALTARYHFYPFRLNSGQKGQASLQPRPWPEAELIPIQP